MKSKLGRLSLWVVVVALASVGYYASTGFDTIWFAIWVAPLPLLLYSYYRGVRSVLLAALVVTFLGWASLFEYVGTSMPLIWVIGLSAIRVVAYCLIFLINRFLVLQLRNWLGIFVFPCLVVLYEFAFQSWSGFGTTGSLAYTQLSNMPIAQLASLTGNLGVTFIIALLPAAVANAWYLRHREKQAGLSMVVMLLVVIAAMTFGIIRLHQNQYKGTVRVGLAAMSVKSVAGGQSNLLAQYQQAVKSLSAQGAKIILLPESAVTVTAREQKKVQATFARVAKKNQAMLIVGVKLLKGAKEKEVAWIFGRQGALAGEYSEHHQLPWRDKGVLKGKSLTLILTPYGPGAVEICQDTDFANPSRAYGMAGAGLLFVPAKDYGVDSWFHARPAIFRGVEDNFSVVRSASQGLLSVTSPRGQLLAKRNTCKSGMSLLLANVPVASGRSFYSKYGDWFGWFTLGLFVILLLIWESIRIRRLKALGKW